MSLLVVDHLAKRFGGLRAVDDLSFEVPARTAYSIIGPNGAGKTTLLNLMTGIYAPDTGRVSLAGQDLTGQPTHRWAAAGLGRTFQNLQVFFNMSALENVMTGRHLHEVTALVPAIFRLPTLRRADVALATGIPSERSVRWWRAMGFPEVGDEAVAFGPAEIEILRRIDSFVDASVLTEDDVLRLARTMGVALSRVTDAQVELLAAAIRVELSGAHPPEHQDDVLPAAIEAMGEAVTYLWTHHLLAALTRALVREEGAVDQAVGFADMTGFSRLSRSLGTGAIARLIDAFEAAVFDAVTSLGGRVIKLIGDEVLFVAPDIMVAAEITMGIAERVAANDDMPPIHCGAAYVNLAARLTSVARPGTLVVPRVDADPLIERWGDRVRRIHRLTDLKGIGQVRSVAIRLSGDEEPVAAG